MKSTASAKADVDGEVRHDHALAVMYFVVAIAVLGFYGIRVCPFIASLDAWSVLVTFGIGFGAALLLKLVFEERLMPAGEPFTLSVYQFFIDLGLFLAVGIGIALYNHYVQGFPLESGLKVLVGCAMFGLFAGLDNGLRRERRTPGLAHALVDEGRRIFPITDRLILIFSGIAVFAGIVAALVVIKDIDYLIAHIHDEPHWYLRRAVFIDMAFIIGVVLLLSVRLLWAYGQNLAYMLRLQIDGLDHVARGDLDTRVPIITRDEFSLIAAKTNRMIESLRRAHREQSELFEVSIALATELVLDRLLARIVATTRDFVEADRVSLFLHDPKRGELWGKIAEGVDQELRFAADQGIAGHVFTTGESLVVPDAYADPRFNPDFDLLTGYRTESLLCVPVIDRDGCVIGVIQALNRTRGTFSGDDARRLRAFAAQAAVALVNAQLFADLDRARRYNESILRSLSNGVVTLDAEQRVVKANQAARALLGQPAQLEGLPFTRVLGDDNPWWQTLWSEAGETYLADTTMVLADGSSRAVNLMRVPLADLEDQNIGSMLVLEDVTEEKRVRNTLSRYLPPQVAEQVLADKDSNLGGVSQVATVLFSDIRDFTTISERMGARETVAMLNEYFSVMADAISQHHGILDKYIGDAIMAVFGVPFAGSEDADHAVRAALSMLARLDHFNRVRGRRGQDAVGMGIGLSTGELVAGNIGSPKRMDYTVIGDTVNLASRLESATKTYGAQLLVSGQTMDALHGNYRSREVDRLRVKGKVEPVVLFQILAGNDSLSAGALEAFGAGREAYRRHQWDAAIACFEEALGESAADPVSGMYIERCRQLRAHAPAENWDGVWPPS
ncbi:MAG TPA: adenylate/guanylate cyclase domain-containing protein [Xanthomonadaceae bacterium]|nr:adenylate/guanylate cyclase domain-containing protein [Xanthomonadaceae bacterium]